MPTKFEELMDTEKPQDEAEPVEGEEGEPEPEPAEEPEPEPESAEEPQAKGRKARSAKQQQAAFEREHTRHEAKLRELIGDDFDALEPCAHCFGLGFAPPEPALLGHDNFKGCDVCNGYGAVLTGSRTEEGRTAKCPRCGGQGYLTRQSQPAPPPSAPPQEDGQQEEWGVEPWMGDPTIQAQPASFPAQPGYPGVT